MFNAGQPGSWELGEVEPVRAVTGEPLDKHKL